MTRPRIDPRQAREAHRVISVGRSRFDLAAKPVGVSRRPRRDPRRERAELMVADAGRMRLDRARPSGMAQPLPQREAAAAAPSVRIIENPVFLVLVIADPIENGTLSAVDRQALGAARALAGGEGGVVLCAEALTEVAGRAGADRLITAPAGLSDPETRAVALEELVGLLQPRHVILPETADGGDLARRLAVRLGEPLFAGAEQVSPRGLVRRVRGRQVDQRAMPPRIVTVEPDMVAPHSGIAHEARPLEVDVRWPGAMVTPAERIRPDAASLSLAEADFVAAVGNGISDLEAFRSLVAALGATPGASRMVCDAGLMPRAAQVGASGTVLSADCYLALGIAGAPQHLQGIAGCRHVVAVNTDLHAAMIERAELAIVADAQAVMPAILRLLAEEERQA
ncbi:electron transfer flavoprotein alpha subunit apoprotein [Faunimonas pinastri]|uniref:Electron transfer flavoprotein alpha subunit apoprotein n=1 Tax=Faunimonas pinastri TaxID=1855383 RepID=A0A1H9HWK1_9HYPH|nr:electron transfer flavoprotein subunit alpha/FixB family protein [Faunimonas pinastri]SEQ66731.1 electron transfer flavoprotein alpha subunit apoprotein [Faunimonas pinastri]